MSILTRSLLFLAGYSLLSPGWAFAVSSENCYDLDLGSVAKKADIVAIALRSNYVDEWTHNWPSEILVENVGELDFASLDSYGQLQLTVSIGSEQLFFQHRGVLKKGEKAWFGGGARVKECVLTQLRIDSDRSFNQHGCRVLQNDAVSLVAPHINGVSCYDPGLLHE